jgi:hypothetical protein
VTRHLSFGYFYRKESTMRLDRDYPPNKSPEPTPVGAGRNSRRFQTHYVAVPAWLSFCRSVTPRL